MIAVMFYEFEQGRPDLIALIDAGLAQLEAGFPL